jgi:glyoxylase-like metal-dependent hydrolase (beta-lactamase superfamily II)
MNSTKSSSVLAVRYGLLRAKRSDIFMAYADYGESDTAAELAYYFWVVDAGENKILVDTGFDPVVGERRGRQLCIDPVEAWEQLGVTDSESTLVVLSHAHYDHIGNVRHLKQAQFLMSHFEYDFWVENPRDQHLTRQLIEPQELAVLRELRESGRLTLISENTMIADGVELILTPGHTPGQLMVKVDTRQGPLLLAADAVHVDEELERRMPFRHMCDLVAGHDSYVRIDEMRSAGEISQVIAGHEPSLMSRYEAAPNLPEHAITLGHR